MSHLRTRLLALTCTAAAALSARRCSRRRRGGAVGPLPDDPLPDDPAGHAPGPGPAARRRYAERAGDRRARRRALPPRTSARSGVARPDRAADAAPAAGDRGRHRRRRCGRGDPRHRHRRLPRRAPRAARHRLVDAMSSVARPQPAGPGPDRQGRHGRRRRLRLRRHATRTSPTTSSHNVTLLSAEYANQPADSTNTIVVPVDQGPYSNTDLGSGHGTHVAGIIAADSLGRPTAAASASRPDAELACFAIGAGAVHDRGRHRLRLHARPARPVGIDVVNNSWGNSFRQFDPRDPVAVATKAVADRASTVVFAAGNSGAEDGEASLNPFNQAPWVISVAAGTLDRDARRLLLQRPRFDNSQAVPIGEGGPHGAARRPDRPVRTPMSPPRAPTSPRPATPPAPSSGRARPARTPAPRGTSMASPAHRRRRGGPAPGEPPSARPGPAGPPGHGHPGRGRDGRRASAPFWQVGYGHVTLDRAVALVRGDGWRADLGAAKKAGGPPASRPGPVGSHPRRPVAGGRAAGRCRRLLHRHAQGVRDPWRLGAQGRAGATRLGHGLQRRQFHRDGHRLPRQAGGCHHDGSAVHHRGRARARQGRADPGRTPSP